MDAPGDERALAFRRLVDGTDDPRRWGAPEPVLVAPIADVAPPSALRQAFGFFSVAVRFTFLGRSRERQLVARSLAARVGELPPDDRRFLDAAVLVELAPWLSLEAALALAEERLEWLDRPADPERSVVLAALAASVPAERSAKLAAAALDALPEDPAQAAETLARLQRIDDFQWRRDELAARAREQALANRQDLSAVRALAILIEDGFADRAIALDAGSDLGALDLRDRLGLLSDEDRIGLPGPDYTLDDGVLAAVRSAAARLDPETAEGELDAALWRIYVRWSGAPLAASRAAETEPSLPAAPADAASLPPPPAEAEPPITGTWRTPPPLPPPAAAVEPPEPAARGAASYTNVGFEDGDGRPVAGPVAPERPYLFWLELGPLLEESIVERPIEFPRELLPARARLTVAIFAVGDGLRPNGESTADLLLDGGTQRLRFPVRAPAARGRAALRCSIYCNGTLVQSLLASVHVGRKLLRRWARPRAQVDFTLSTSLRPEHLEAVTGDDLSLMLNQGDDGSQNVFLYVEGEEPVGAALDGNAVQDLVSGARRSLRRASWGSEDEWSRGAEYRYERPDRAKLAEDLGRLAVAGFTIYDALIDRFLSRPQASALAERMRGVRRVQVAVKSEPRLVVPAALLYDHRGFDDQAPAYSLCPEFERALDAGERLETTPCFYGNCPVYDEPDAVCPSGFWGFRHELALPVALPGDAAPEIRFGSEPVFAVGASADPELELRDDHLDRLRHLRTPLGWHYGRTRQEVLELMEGSCHVLYLYCHGGLKGTKPYLRVGPESDRAITRASLRRLLWATPGPLVFVNGCHTTALEPEQAVEFVSAFVAAQASGVIGTEITVLEELATVFAERFFGRFVVDGEALAAAVRGARLDLLAQGNPLGLVYIPFSHASLRLVA